MDERVSGYAKDPRIHPPHRAHHPCNSRPNRTLWVPVRPCLPIRLGVRPDCDSLATIKKLLVLETPRAKRTGGFLLWMLALGAPEVKVFLFQTAVLSYFTQQLETLVTLSEQALSRAHGSNSAHTAAAVSCALLGISDSVAGYVAMPEMHPRSVRRLTAQANLLLSERKTDSDLAGETPTPVESKTVVTKQNKFRVVSDSTANPPPELKKLALAASVPILTAYLAHVYFRNPLERVLNVLQDIADLKTVSQGATNPKALFTWMMRRPSENVKLPVSILEARAAALEAAETAQKKAVLTAENTVVLWMNRTKAKVIKFFAGLDVLEIELLQDTNDGFSGDIFKVPIHQIRAT